MAMDDLLAEHSDIEANFPSELRAFYQNVEYGLGVSEWQKGNRTAARRHLVRHWTRRTPT